MLVTFSKTTQFRIPEDCIVILHFFASGVVGSEVCIIKEQKWLQMILLYSALHAAYPATLMSYLNDIQILYEY